MAKAKLAKGLKWDGLKARNLMKRQGRQLLFDVAGSIFYAIGVYTFAAHASFAPGGVTGAAVILNHLLKVPIGTTALMMNIPIVALSF